MKTFHSRSGNDRSLSVRAVYFTRHFFHGFESNWDWLKMSDKLAKFDFFQSSPIEQNNFDNPLEKTAERTLILSIFCHGKYDFLIYFICILENSNNSIFRHLQGSPDGSIARLYRPKCIIPFREIFKNFARTRVQLCAAWVLRCVRGSLSTGVYRIKL